MSKRESWRGPPETLYLAIKRLAERHVEQFERKFPANSAAMGKELPRSIGALHKVHGIAVRRFRLDDGNKNGIEIWKVGKGRQIPSPDEGPEKEETELDFLTEEDFFSEAVATRELPTPAYPTQDKPEPPPKPPTFVSYRRR